MLLKKTTLAVIFIIIMFTGCSSVSLNNIDKNYVNNISNKKEYKEIKTISIVSFYGGQIKHKSSISGKTCENRRNLLFDNVAKNTNKLADLFEIRNVVSEDLNLKAQIKRLLIIRPYSYTSLDASKCYADNFEIDIYLYDLEEISSKWHKKTKQENIQEISKLQDKYIIWKKRIFLKFDKYDYFSQKNTIEEIWNKIITALEEDELIPPAFKTLEDLKKERNLKKTICFPTLDEFSLRDSKDVLCIKNMGFPESKRVNSQSSYTILNASMGKNKYLINNSSCRNLVTSFAVGNKENQSVSFDKTYKRQLLDFYKNKCLVKSINDINFLECTKDDKKEYFLEHSKKIDNRIYEKYLVQMNNMCFDKLYNEFDNLNNKLWRTAYGFNSKGWNAKAVNKDTNSLYDKEGFDYKGWNKKGINKFTNTIYDKEGFTKEGEHKDGVDKDGWSKKLKKFIKRVDRKIETPFEIRDFTTKSKNEIYNRDFYDSVYIEVTKDGTRIVAKKSYQKEKIVKKYYFFTMDNKQVIDLSENNSTLKQDLKLEKIIEEKI